MSARKTLLLVRHAESAHNADARSLETDTDTALTDRGHTQAQALCESIAHEFNFNTREISLISSDMKRCVQTLAPLSARLGVAVTLDRALREPEQHNPCTQVVDAEQARAMLEAMTADAVVHKARKSETHAELVARLRSAIERALASPCATVVLCSHFVTLNVLARMLVEPEAPRAGLWASFDNASRTRFEIAPSGAATLVYLNRA